MTGPTVTRGRTFGSHQSALHVDETPVGRRTEDSTKPAFSRFSPRRIPFVSQLMKRWGKGRDERSQSRPPLSSEQPPIPTLALTPAIEVDSSPLPTLPMVVLSIVCPPLISFVCVDLTIRRRCWVNSCPQMCQPRSCSSWSRVSPLPPQITPPDSGIQALVSTPKKQTSDFGPASSVCYPSHRYRLSSNDPQPRVSSSLNS